MWCNHLIIISIILPTLKCQLYFPDENNGGYMQLSNDRQSAFAARPNLPPVVNLTELRGTTVYEQYVDKIIATGILKLTLDVERALITSSPNNYNSIVYSPVNIAGALAMILLGSIGSTFEEISTIMGLATGVEVQNKSEIVHEQFGRLLHKLQDTSGFNLGRQVNFATAVFVQEEFPIREVYRETAEALYKSEVLNVDFQSDGETAKQIINAWVSERTQGKIRDILSEKPSSDTKVILASAMYFKAEWEKPFFDGTTKRRPFYTNGRSAKSDVMVEMMSNGGLFPYYKDSTLNCELLGFPYKGNQTTMYVLIPANSDKPRLKQLEERLTHAEIERLVAAAKYTGVIALFPKMRIDTTVDLRRTLQELGVRSLFDPSRANLAVMSPGKGSAPGAAPNPLAVAGVGNDVIIFSRNGEPRNCTQIFESKSENQNLSKCEEVSGDRKVTYKRFGNKVGRKVTSRIAQTLDGIRESVKGENPRLYADNVIHKVYMDITESGTEAAAATSVSLSRDGGRVTVRVDVPFLFFIMHEETKTVLFWGSVNTPTPSFG